MKSIKRLFDNLALPVFSLAVFVLNLSLAFDNVLWGDEAFSATTVQGTNIAGVVERIFYLDAHPPLYYIWLWVVSTIGGHSTAVYHIASLIPFWVCLVLGCTYVKKHFGSLSAWMFVILISLSSSCVEYNLEVRMYSLVFLFVFLCAIFSYRIVTGPKKLSNWVFITLFGVLTAYSHYLGAAATGILLFVTSVIYAIENRKNEKRAWLYGVISILSYIVLYLPWSKGLLRQVTSGGNWWRTAPDPINEVFTFMMFGERIKIIAILLSVFGSLYIFLKDSRILSFHKGEDENTVLWKINKPCVKCWSSELKMILTAWAAILLFLGFGYAVSYLVSPLMLARYSYPIVPLVMMALICVVKRLSDYTVLKKDEEQKCVKIKSSYKNFTKRLIYIFLATCLALTFAFGLLDFKYFRSVTKVQDAETSKILNLIGEPSESTVFDGYGVRHLSWTVLKYYYPESEIKGVEPLAILDSSDTETVDEIWLFIDRELDEEETGYYSSLGYNIETHPDMWMGQYGCNVIHIFI